MATDQATDADDELTLLRDALGLGESRATDAVLLNAIRIANEVEALAPERGRVLVWGAGQGELAFLLGRRALDVTAYDVTPDEGDPPQPLFSDVSIEYGTDPIALPYPDQSFDAVLANGTLEHVPYPAASLAELARVLRPGGRLFLYNLPQRWSWSERTRDLLRLGGTHGRRFSVKDVEALFKATGFRVERVRRVNLLPQRLLGMPEPMQSAYRRMTGGPFDVDRRLSSVPVVNRVAGSLEVIAIRE